MATEKPTVKVTQEMLLVEENTMIGSIILSTARQLQLRPVRLVTSCKSAQLFLENQVFCGLITYLDEAGTALDIIHQVRCGKLRCAANMPVAVTTAQCDAPMANRIKALDVQRILLKPFKIRDLITTIQTLVESPEQEAPSGS